MLLPVVFGSLVTIGCQTIPGQDVRYEPTPMPVVRAMLRLADVRPHDVVYDLGSGDGRIPITAATEFGARGVGIEIDPALVARARENARQAGVEDKVEFRLGDMYGSDVGAATVVTLFLHPQPNLKLRPKLRSDLKPGSRVVSYIWDMGDWTPEEVRSVNRRRIFLWRIPTGAARTLSRRHGSLAPQQDGPGVARVRPRHEVGGEPCEQVWTSHGATDGNTAVRAWPNAVLCTSDNWCPQPAARSGGNRAGGIY